MISITPVILCGGSGTRLWPLSRADYPKQFIRLNNDATLFQKTLLRLKALSSKSIKLDEIIVVTNESHRFLVLDQLKGIKIKAKIKIILEPCSLNTAPALTLAAAASPNSTLLVIPSDQYIDNEEAFASSIQRSVESIKDQLIYIFGVKPKSAEDSYGYILYEGNGNIKTVVDFIEKPDFKYAKKIIGKKKCFWNLGIFVLTSKTWMASIKKANKSIFDNVTNSWAKRTVDNAFVRPRSSSYSKATSKSIDYAVMEKAISLGIDVKAIEIKTNWSDIGQHMALERLFKKNREQNILQGNVIAQDANNTTVIGSDRHIALLGVQDLIVIDTKDSLLIVNKNSSASMRALIKKLNKIHKEILREHSIVHRPWGFYEIITQQKNSKIKKIVVYPNSELSYQSHKYRSEHWIVLKGIATIKKNGVITRLSPDESMYISSGDKHKLMNNQNTALEIIEVQTGKKLSENDIIRYDDIYGR